MSGTPRFIPPSSTGALVEVTYRTIQGRFLLKPSPVLNELVVGVLARREGRETEVAGREAICLQNPQTRPNELQRSPAPLVHAASKRERLAWREAFAWFVLQYREASERLRSGERDAPFPEGCFPPGLPFVGTAGGVPLPAAAP